MRRRSAPLMPAARQPAAGVLPLMITLDGADAVLYISAKITSAGVSGPLA